MNAAQAATQHPDRRKRFERFVDHFNGTHRYGVVLIFVFISFLWVLIFPDNKFGQTVAAFLQAMTLLLSIWTTGVRRSVFIGLSIACGALVVLSAISWVATDDAAATRLLSGMLLLVSPVVIAHGVLASIKNRRRVTLHAVFGALCIYLLIGLIFAFAYAAAHAITGYAQISPVHGDEIQDSLYFSFITLTTVGYGDLVPSTEVGRALAIFEALLGQIYLVTVVAVMVSNLGRPQTPGQLSGSQPHVVPPPEDRDEIEAEERGQTEADR